MNANIQIIMAFLIYAIALISVGYIFSKREKKSSEFALGGRSTNYWVTAIALQASDMSHWLFMGLPGIAYTCGLVRIWEAVGISLFMFLTWHFVAPRLREQTEKLNTITLFSYFEKRYNDNKGIIRLISSVISVVFFTFYIASGLVAIGRLLQAAFEIPYSFGVLAGLSTAILYTLVGGFVAVAWCDFFQGLFALFMIILVPTVAYFGMSGGWQEIAQAAYAKGVSLNPFSIPFRQIIPLLFIWGPGYFGQPHLLSFFMGINDPKKLKYSKYIGTTWQALALIAAILIGIIGLAYPFTGADEMIFILLTKSLFFPFLAGLVLCAILAAALSTLDSQILTSGTVIAEDIYKKINKSAPENLIRWISRFGAIIVSLIALYISFSGTQTIYNLVNYAWSGMGSAFGPLVLASLYARKVNRYGAIAGIISGAATSAIFPYITESIPALIPGFIISAASIFVVSALTLK